MKHICVNYILTDEKNATGSKEASKKPRESDSCEYHSFIMF